MHCTYPLRDHLSDTEAKVFPQLSGVGKLQWSVIVSRADAFL
jgi:hypothetical protein